MRIKINKNEAQDLYNIHHGVYAPLQGFLREEDFISVCRNMRLRDESVWSMPIALRPECGDAENIEKGDDIILTDKDGFDIAVLRDVDIYKFDKKRYISLVYGTDDPSHPGVADILAGRDFMMGGDLKWVRAEEKDDHFLTPQETRDLFKSKGWGTIAAFQTRNVPHRSHEFLQQKALEITDAVFIHPVIGEKKPGDFRDDLILKSYKKLLKDHFPPDRYHLGTLPIKMRYAGPREAVMHALIRRNFGCTHMMIGRDHAGVGDFYPPFAAQEIFDRFKKKELGIEILKFADVHYCPACASMTFERDCPHEPEGYLKISGTKMREMIKKGEKPPKQFTRPDIAELIIEHGDPFVR
jgi:sulfate adenylyltransferase